MRRRIAEQVKGAKAKGLSEIALAAIETLAEFERG